MTIPSFIPNLIGGEARPTRSGETVPVLDPHTGALLATTARSRGDDVGEAVDAARAAQDGWARTTPVKRGEILYRICTLLEQRAEVLSAIVAAEAGKRPQDAMGETGAAIQCGRFFAGEGQRLYGRTTTSGTPGKTAMTVRAPCGVAGLIIASNTPAPNFAWKVFPALICGNAVVLKAAEDTPASSWFMAQVAAEAGLPAGVLNVVNGLGSEAGQALVDAEGIDVLSFTGSTRVGRMIGESAGRRLLKVSLELGGKNALVVCDDADLDAAAKWACLAAFSNAGQRCAAGSRIIVMADVYDAFAQRFVAATRALKLGVAADCDVGPVINARQLEAMQAALGRALYGGATLLAGGEKAAGDGLADGFYLQPTILADIAGDAESSVTELFGPITALYRAGSFEDALVMANDSPYGLTASIHTTRIERAFRFIETMKTGVAVVNGGTHGSEPHMPFGGVKSSGNGSREPGTEALDVYSNLKDVYINLRA